MKVFICSPYNGLEENYYRAINYCKYVIEKGHTPICPATMYHKSLDDRIPLERRTFQNLSKELQCCCDEIWVFGQVSTTDSMVISGSGKPIKYIKDTFRFNSESEMLSVLCREYETATNKMINRTILDSMLYYINLGLTDKLIISAVKKAALKDAGWSYTEGILKNCLSRGIKTAEEFEQANNRKNSENNHMAAYDLGLYEQMLNSKD